MRILHFFLAIIILLAWFHNTKAQNSAVVINEVVSISDTAYPDNFGEASDWIELMNISDAGIDLFQWSITDDREDTLAWVFPSIYLASGEKLLLFASGRDIQEAPWYHTSFGIKSGKEGLVLYDNQGVARDSIPALCIPRSTSYGRQPDGTGSFHHLREPSPGGSNDFSAVFEAVIYPDTVFFSHQGGPYGHAISVSLSNMHDANVIRYTLDGSWPDDQSPRYDTAILLFSVADSANYFSDIETSPDWKPPDDKVNKYPLIRAQSYTDGCPAGSVLSNTYFIDTHFRGRYTLPIISVTADKSAFFGYNKGIYVPGVNQHPDYLRATGNCFMRGGAWEREVHVEYFSSEGQLLFEQDAGARIHGNMSRGFPQKSLRLYSRPEYGKAFFEYPFFPDNERVYFPTIILRTPEADLSGSLFKDELCHEIVKGLDLDIMDQSPCIVFLNGEYWGIHNIRERQDEDYLAYYHGISPDSLDILSEDLEIIQGSNDDYSALLDYISAHDLSDSEAYEWVCERIDIDNLIDYQIVQLYFANMDWPDKNIKYWKPANNEGKWRWLFFDCDRCFIRDTHSLLPEYIEGHQGNARPDWSVFLMQQLMKNAEFRDIFMKRFYSYMQTVFEPSRVLGLIDDFQKTFAPEVAEHIKRWNRPQDFDDWSESIEDLRFFAISRPSQMLEQLVRVFGIPFKISPNPGYGNIYLEREMENADQLNLKIFNISGQLVKEIIMDDAAAEMDISGLQSGAYIFRITSGSFSYSLKYLLLDNSR